jgi:hypothetical protein
MSREGRAVDAHRHALAPLWRLTVGSACTGWGLSAGSEGTRAAAQRPLPGALSGPGPVALTDLRRSFDLLMMRVLSSLQGRRGAARPCSARGASAGQVTAGGKESTASGSHDWCGSQFAVSNQA